MRSDHLGDCGHFEGFAELVNATQYLLPRMRDDALLRAIREPARLFGGEVAPDLAVRLVDESRAEIDALPLVQHALMRLWRQAGGATDQAPRPPSNPGAPHPVLTAAGLRPARAAALRARRGGARGGRGRAPGERQGHRVSVPRAHRDRRRGPRHPPAAAAVRAGRGDRRRPAALERVVDRFAQPDCGFLARSSDQDPMIDLGHEALIRCWKKLDDPTLDARTQPPRRRGWLQREREDARIWRSMLVQAEAGDRISPPSSRIARPGSLPCPGPTGPRATTAAGTGSTSS